MQERSGWSWVTSEDAHSRLRNEHVRGLQGPPSPPPAIKPSPTGKAIVAMVFFNSLSDNSGEVSQAT